MGKYKEVKFITGHQEIGWYKSHWGDKAYYPADNLVVIMWESTKKIDHYLDANLITREEFKLELALRNSTVWQAVNGGIK